MKKRATVHVRRDLGHLTAYAHAMPGELLSLGAERCDDVGVVAMRRFDAELRQWRPTRVAIGRAVRRCALGRETRRGGGPDVRMPGRQWVRITGDRAEWRGTADVGVTGWQCGVVIERRCVRD